MRSGGDFEWIYYVLSVFAFNFTSVSMFAFFADFTSFLALWGLYASFSSCSMRDVRIFTASPTIA